MAGRGAVGRSWERRHPACTPLPFAVAVAFAFPPRHCVERGMPKAGGEVPLAFAFPLAQSGASLRRSWREGGRRRQGVRCRCRAWNRDKGGEVPLPCAVPVTAPRVAARSPRSSAPRWPPGYSAGCAVPSRAGTSPRTSPPGSSRSAPSSTPRRPDTATRTSARDPRRPRRFARGRRSAAFPGLSRSTRCECRHLSPSGCPCSRRRPGRRRTRPSRGRRSKPAPQDPRRDESVGSPAPGRRGRS